MILFVFRLNVPVNNFSVLSGRIFLMMQLIYQSSFSYILVYNDIFFRSTGSKLIKMQPGLALLSLVRR